MARRVLSLLLGVLAASCGSESSSASPPAPDGTVVSVAAMVRNAWTTETGTVALVRWSPAGYALTLDAPMVNQHFVSGAAWVFTGSAIPAAGTYTTADAAPGSWFASSDGGDIYRLEPGVSGFGGATLTLTEASASALRGTLDVNLKFTSFHATFEAKPP